MKHLLATSALLIILCACTPPPKPIIKYEYPPIIHPKFPAQLILPAPRLRVINQSNSVYFAMTPNNYEVLAGNIQELKRYINQSKVIIRYYRRVLSTEETNLDK